MTSWSSRARDPRAQWREKSEPTRPKRFATADADLLDEIDDLSYRYESEPHFVHGGPALASTCLTIAPRDPPIIWDVNSYYRDLGVPTDATRRQIADAYRDGNGPASTHLTMIVKTLLDPIRRADYDAMPFGSRFFDQEYADEIRRRISQRASDMMSQISPEERDRIIEEELGSEMVDMLGRELDLDLENGENWRPGWGWSYFVLRTRCDDEARLAQWQACLVEAWNEVYPHVVHLAVGFVADQPLMVIPDGDRTILLIGEREQPTLRLAREAVGRVPDSAK